MARVKDLKKTNQFPASCKYRKRIKLDTHKVPELQRIQQLDREGNKVRVENDFYKKAIEFNSESRKTPSNS